ncbi:amidohydrolase [Marinitenerispora sediminis]|uniref:Peptidase M20 domain-containing protein 2 n=1 Tax=Marinitenerispora sediminis TaxID=1931232 RepID=A0A368TDG7_9ACTN|nr:amidohydrolase [Marinitenerispora sediminis]RCV53976.1 amidohydrolase [Marinitenerispora sediminis]RCV60473.1 amidohydrolase [Marinitenerispora sediminis]RCV61846.1 amidohydrolase [Marinitenerispora sediminis]
MPQHDVARHEDACRRAVAQAAPDLHALSADIHAHPETAFAEHYAAGRISGVLADAGFTVTRGIAGLDTALVAEYGGGDLVVGLCAEYDALPGIGHACGHNVIAAAAVGAALALRGPAADLGLTVRLIGTPAEESGGGKITMLEAGVFDDVALAMMVHPAPHEVCAPRSLAIQTLRVRYRGRAAHAAVAPHLGRSAADALTIAHVALGLARQHLPPRHLVHGITLAAGSSPNTVPDHAEAVFDLRAPDAESLAELEERVRGCLAAGAAGADCAHEVVRDGPAYAELVHDPWLVAAYRSAVTRLGRTPVPPEQEAAVPTGSTDMGNVSRVVPSLHPTMALECGDAVNHQPEFAAACRSASAERAVRDGATALAWTACAAAADSDRRAALIDGVRGRAAGPAR